MTDADYVLSLDPMFFGLKPEEKMQLINGMTPQEKLRRIKSMDIPARIKFSMILAMPFDGYPEEATSEISSVKVNTRRVALVMGMEQRLRDEIRKTHIGSEQELFWRQLSRGTPKNKVAGEWISRLGERGIRDIRYGYHRGEDTRVVIPQFVDRMDRLVKKHRQVSRVQ